MVAFYVYQQAYVQYKSPGTLIRIEPYWKKYQRLPLWKNGKPVQATITGGWQNNLKMKWPKGVKKVLLNDTACRTDSFIPFTVKQGECITFIFE